MKIAIPWDHQVLALSKPSAARKSRSLKGKSGQGKPKRLTKDEFLKLGKSEQRRYLEVYPKSSHRFAEGRRKPKGRPAEKSQRTNRETDRQEKFPRKITRDEFDRLGRKEQREYKKKYPENSFRGIKHFVTKRRNVVQKNKTGDYGETVFDGSEPRAHAVERRKMRRRVEQLGRDESRQSLRHGITQESVQAATSSKPEDLYTVSENLKRNRSANLSSIEDSLDSTVHVQFDSKQAESALRRLKQQELDEAEDWDPKDLKRVEKLLKDPDPKKLSAEDKDLLERVVSEREKRNKIERENMSWWRRDLNTVMKVMRGEKVDPQGKSNAALLVSVISRYAMIAGGVVALSMGAAPVALYMAQSLFESWGEFNATAGSDDETDEDQLGAVYDAIADFVQHVDHEEMVTFLNKGFREFGPKGSQISESSSDKVEDTILNALIDAGCAITRRSGGSVLHWRRRAVRAERVIEIVRGASYAAGYEDYASEKGDDGSFLYFYEKNGKFIKLYGSVRGHDFGIVFTDNKNTIGLESITL